MAIEQDLEEDVAHDDLTGGNKNSLKWRSEPDSITGSDNPSGGFECNICLDSVQDPVVTLCGHLFCWPCIYKWLHFQSISSEENEEQKQKQCPVCKAEVTQTSLIPLYGRGLTTKHSKGKAPQLGIVIPKRPLGPVCGVDAPRSGSSSQFSQQFHHPHSSHQSHMYYSQQGSYPASPMLSPGSTTANLFDPVIGIFGEMVYARIFGNSITNIYSHPNTYNLVGNSSPRIRRHVMQADKSLSRISFFLLCCLILCLLLF
ncbi:hypothetical protein SLE2022_050150 [Rubroshorea leprosula]